MAHDAKIPRETDVCIPKEMASMVTRGLDCCLRCWYSTREHRFLVALLLVQIPVDAIRKAAGDGCGAWTCATHVGDGWNSGSLVLACSKPGFCSNLGNEQQIENLSCTCFKSNKC